MKKSSLNHLANVGQVQRFQGLENVEHIGDSVQPGVIAFANETRFNMQYFSVGLTNYATGWQDQEGVEELLNHISPVVMVPRRFAWNAANNAEAFVSELDDVRGIGGSFKTVEYTSTKVDSSTQNKGLRVQVDTDEVDGIPNWRELAVGRLRMRLARNELRRALSLLDAAASNTSTTWSGADSPDSEIMRREKAYADIVGQWPNTGIIDIASWLTRVETYEAQATAGGFQAAKTPAEVGQKLLLSRGLRVSKEYYIPVGTSTTKSSFVSGKVYLYTALDNATLSDPSNLKRFVTAQAGATAGSYRVYEQQLSSKIIEITVEHYSKIVVTSTLGIQKMTVS